MVILMNKKNGKSLILIGVVFVVLAGVGIYIYYNSSNSSNSKEYEANRTSTSNNVNNSTNNTATSEEKDETDDETDKESSSDEKIDNEDNQNKNEAEVQTPPPEPAEEEIASFSTKIYSSDSARQNNINITCNTLNGTVVKVGDTFSFCNTVGQATSDKGYQKADIFDKNGNKEKGLGGGNCQVSTTLYNAVLAVPALQVTERHEHSNYVPYIEEGKDAAVAYGSYDLKFVNNVGHEIKITAATDGNSISISIVALKAV